MVKHSNVYTNMTYQNKKETPENFTIGKLHCTTVYFEDWLYSEDNPRV